MEYRGPTNNKTPCESDGDSDCDCKSNSLREIPFCVEFVHRANNYTATPYVYSMNIVHVHITLPLNMRKFSNCAVGNNTH